MCGILSQAELPKEPNSKSLTENVSKPRVEDSAMTVYTQY